MDTEATTRQLAHHLMAAVEAAERLNDRAPHDPALLRLCIHLYDAAEQLEATAAHPPPPRTGWHGLFAAVAD